MATTEQTLPVRMRIGNGDEFKVGTVTLDLSAEAATPDLPGVRANLAAMLRSAADAVETGEGTAP
jgi:hypothetical protein